MAGISHMFAAPKIPDPAAAVRMPDIADPAIQDEARRRSAMEARRKGRASTNLEDEATAGVGSGAPTTYGNTVLG